MSTMNLRPQIVSALFLLLAASAPLAARADVKLPAVIASRMVLQQQTEAPLWGWADPGEKVVVEMGEARAETVADADGRWSLKLKTPAAGGPFKLHVIGKNKIELSDVLVGEVWLCSGQSNMQWSVTQSANPQEEIAAADYPNIRLFTVARNPAEEPVEDCNGAWEPCSPKTVGGFSAVGYYFGRKLNKELDVPVGLINSSWGGTICEAWTCQEKLAANPEFSEILKRGRPFKAGNPNQAANLFNGMIHPLVPFALRGAIWYQGESNRTRAEQYATLFPTMIADWREHWGQGDFPFYFVQLAPFQYGQEDPAILAELWEAQLKTLKNVPHTGMAVTTDIGDLKDIHPKNKQDVGLRLALWALNQTYGRSEVVPSGPLYVGHTVEDDRVRIKFEHVGGGLVAKGGELTHFEICGDDGKFVPATAKIFGENVVVQSDQVKKPVAVRFAWHKLAEPNFFNKEGLPASPFRTDDFPLVTAGAK